MRHRFWLERWQRNEIGFHMERPHHFLTRFFDRLQLSAGDRVFVPLCGKSPDLTWLHEQGVQVVGIELSPVAVADFFRENQLAYRVGLSDALQHYTADGYDLYCGDLHALKPAQLLGARAVYDRGSLVAMPAAMRGDYAQTMTRLVPIGSRVLLVSYEYDPSEIEGPPFAVPMTELETLFGTAFTIELLAEIDALPTHQALEERGLTRLKEFAVLLTRL